ncbi:MAG: hypothetical protein JWN03_3251 [Nocardia sp.]|nr:hypothetical protein [Nocardia sp.]
MLWLAIGFAVLALFALHSARQERLAAERHRSTHRLTYLDGSGYVEVPRLAGVHGRHRPSHLREVVKH